MLDGLVNHSQGFIRYAEFQVDLRDIFIDIDGSQVFLDSLFRVAGELVNIGAGPVCLQIVGRHSGGCPGLVNGSRDGVDIWAGTVLSHLAV